MRTQLQRPLGFLGRPHFRRAVLSGPSFSACLLSVSYEALSIPVKHFTDGETEATPIPMLADGGFWAQRGPGGRGDQEGGKGRAPAGQADGCENGLPTWRAGMG